MTPAETPQGKVALKFAEALCVGAYDEAHAMLSASLKADLSPTKLQKDYEDMIAYGDGPPNLVEVIEALEDWQAKQADDLGWAYAVIAGDSYGEAVAVIVTKELLIRDIEWGRP